MFAPVEYPIRVAVSETRSRETVTTGLAVKRRDRRERLEPLEERGTTGAKDVVLSALWANQRLSHGESSRKRSASSSIKDEGGSVKKLDGSSRLRFSTLASDNVFLHTTSLRVQMILPFSARWRTSLRRNGGTSHSYRLVFLTERSSSSWNLSNPRV